MFLLKRPFIDGAFTRLSTNTAAPKSLHLCFVCCIWIPIYFLHGWSRILGCCIRWYAHASIYVYTSVTHWQSMWVWLGAMVSSISMFSTVVQRSSGGYLDSCSHASIFTTKTLSAWNEKAWKHCRRRHIVGPRLLSGTKWPHTWRRHPRCCYDLAQGLHF